MVRWFSLKATRESCECFPESLKLNILGPTTSADITNYTYILFELSVQAKEKSGSSCLRVCFLKAEILVMI